MIYSFILKTRFYLGIQFLLGLDIAEVHDVGDLILMSGLVDSHVHVNEPGKEVPKM